jgi:hypothetical protein
VNAEYFAASFILIPVYPASGPGARVSVSALLVMYSMEMVSPPQLAYFIQNST